MSVVKDKATAFKNELSGSQTNKIVCKASSHELAGPKKKHVDYLLQLTNHPRCQFTTLVDLIAERLKHTSWVVVFKALILSHNLMSLGNEKVIQTVATRNQIFELDSFSDKTSVAASEMSSYLRKYARYMRFMCISYKKLAVDICRIPKGENSPFRNMEVAKILKSTAVVQDQLDLLLELEFASSELTNGVVNTCFLMLYKDLIKLYTVYNDALINLLEKFFEMKKTECKETIAIYRKFLLRQETVQRFLQLAEDVGVDKETHLNLRQVPEDLLPALETHLSEMESQKKSSGSQPSPQIKAASQRLQQLKEEREKEMLRNKPPSQSGSGVITGFPSASEEVLDAQRKRFEELKKRASEAKMNPASAGAEASKTTPKKDAPAAGGGSGFGDLVALSSTAPTTTPAASTNGNQLNFDPWASSSSSSTQQAPASTNPFQTPSNPAPSSTVTAGNSSSDPWGTAQTTAPNGTSDPWGVQTQNTSAISSYQEVDLFSEIRSSDFNSAFGSSQAPSASTSTPSTAAGVGVALNQYTMGDILTPQAVGPHAQQPATMASAAPKSLTTDVDSSLMAAAANLSTFPTTSSTPAAAASSSGFFANSTPEQLWAGMDVGNTRAGFTKKTDHQWTAKKESVKTGGPNFQRQTLQASTVQQSKGSADWSSGLQAGHFPVQPQPQPMMGGQPGMMGGQPGMMMGGRPPMMGGQPGMMMGGGVQPVGMQQPFMQPGMQPNMWGQPQQQQQNPFGQNPSLL